MLNLALLRKYVGRRRPLAPAQVGLTSGSTNTGLASAAELIEPESLWGARANATPAEGPFQGYIDELSDRHVHGWVRDLSRPGHRLRYQAVLSDTQEILSEGCANEFRHGLSAAGVGDGAYAFWCRFKRPLSEWERRQVQVHVPQSGYVLDRSPFMTSRYEPLLHVAMDIVDNCNLRCPFCVYDYANSRATHFMSSGTLDAALRFLPYTKDGEFWFSCLHEPALHPELIAFIDRIPSEYRRKLFYTTNLAKRMPAAYFDWLAANGMHHVNVSLESREPALYERMRKGARHRIFQENWDALIAALDRAATPTRVRYNIMAYKSNLRELPELTRYLLEERRAWQVEIRYTFDVPYTPAEFKEAEFLDAEEWVWLTDQLSGYPADRVQLMLPPSLAPEPKAPIEPVMRAVDMSPEHVLPGRYMFRLSWDGALKVIGVSAASRNETPIEKLLLNTNVTAIGDPEAFFDDLPACGRASAIACSGTVPDEG